MVTRPWLSWPVGTGNSPPTRKRAASPDTAVRLGSARVRTRPARSNACMMPVALFNPGTPARPTPTQLPGLEPSTVVAEPQLSGPAAIGWVVVSRLRPPLRPPSRAPLTP